MFLNRDIYVVRRNKLAVRRGAADLQVVEGSAVLLFRNQPLPIAYLMPAPYSAGAARCTCRTGLLINST